MQKNIFLQNIYGFTPAQKISSKFDQKWVNASQLRKKTFFYLLTLLTYSALSKSSTFSEKSTFYALECPLPIAHCIGNGHSNLECPSSISVGFPVGHPSAHPQKLILLDSFNWIQNNPPNTFSADCIIFLSPNVFVVVKKSLIGFWLSLFFWE